MAKIMLNGVDYSAPVASGVAGVKGNAESTYRAGNVNLTPANIGAVEANVSNLQKLGTLNGILKWRALSGRSSADNSGYNEFNNYFTNGCKIYATISISDQLHKVCVDLRSPSGSTAVTGSAFSHIRNNGFLLVELGFSVDVEDGAWMVQVMPTQTEYRFLKDGTFSVKDESALSQYASVELRELSFAGNENIDSMVRNGTLPGGY